MSNTKKNKHFRGIIKDLLNFHNFPHCTELTIFSKNSIARISQSKKISNSRPKRRGTRLSQRIISCSENLSRSAWGSVSLWLPKLLRSMLTNERKPRMLPRWQLFKDLDLWSLHPRPALLGGMTMLTHLLLSSRLLNQLRCWSLISRSKAGDQATLLRIYALCMMASEGSLWTRLNGKILV